jgi:hypothetical protein
MATTPLGFHYPALTDAPNGPVQIQQTATDIDTYLTGLPKAATGSSAITLVALNTPVSAAITFPAGLFTTAPIVVCTVQATNPQAYAAAYASASSTGATVYLAQLTGSVVSRTVSWIAIGS